MMFKKKWVSCHDNLQEEILVTLHYFLVLLNSPTVHRSFEGCGWQGPLSTATQDPVVSGGSPQWLVNS